MRDYKRLSQVDVSNPHDVVVLLEGDTAQLRLGDERFVERLQSYLEVAAALRERVTDIDYVDLRFDDRVYVKPRGSARPVEAAKPATARTPRSVSRVGNSATDILIFQNSVSVTEFSPLFSTVFSESQSRDGK